MDRSTKTAAALLAFAGGLFATAALADMGPGGMGKGMGHGDRGAMSTEMFDAIDADKDGKVTAAELGAYRQARFTAADANGDGLLNAEELTAMRLAEMTARVTERTARMLQWMDANGDGSLSAEELPDGPSPERLARLDRDGDGAISREEVEAARDRRGDRKHKQRKWADD